MVAPVEPLLHNNVPVYPTADKLLLPQLFDTVTEGATGTIKGAAFPIPAKLVHPFRAVCVTVKLPEEVTVIEVVVADVPHNKLPVKLLAVNTELPQLFTTDTVGGAGIVLGAGRALANGLEHPFTF